MDQDSLHLTPKRCLERFGGNQSVDVFRIGPPNLAKEEFGFIINLLSVNHAINLISMDTSLPAVAGSYQFKVGISVLGLEMHSSSFDNLVNMEFSSNESWTFNIRYCLVLDFIYI